MSVSQFYFGEVNDQLPFRPQYQKSTGVCEDQAADGGDHGRTAAIR